MQKGDFGKEINKLKTAYKAESFTDERIELFWNILKREEADTLRGAVDFHIRNTKFLPSLAELIATMRSISDKDKTASMRQYGSGFTCEKCRDFGFIFVGEEINPCILCEAGTKITAQEIERQEQAYKRGKEMMAKVKKLIISRSLPYDPTKRLER